MKSFFKRLLTVISSIAAVVALTGLVLVLMGYRPFIIESSSMEPLYRKGSLSWINTRVELSDLQKGDVIAYRAGTDILVFHRVVGIESSSSDELIAEIQGDANSISQKVTLSRVNFIGREASTIPGLGTIVSAISSVPLLIYGLIAILVILACLPHYRLPWKRESKEATP